MQPQYVYQDSSISSTTRGLREPATAALGAAPKSTGMARAMQASLPERSDAGNMSIAAGHPSVALPFAGGARYTSHAAAPTMQ